jgi:hypothetical protein
MDEADVLPILSHRGPIVRLANGSPFPETCSVRFLRNSDPTLPFAYVGLAVVDGRVEPTNFALGGTVGEGGHPVTAADYRWWNFDKTISIAERVGSVLGDVDDRYAAGRLNTFDDVRQLVHETPGNWSVRRSLTDDFLKEIAEVARQNPGRATLAVANHFQTAHRNASRWIKAAKDRGFLADAN